jgi:plasmid stabilization system protein ParE
MHYKVVFRRDAIADLIDIERYIEDRSDARTA